MKIRIFISTFLVLLSLASTAQSTKGQHTQLLIDSATHIMANKPISVVQFSRGDDCDTTDADPFMVVINPIEQVINDITFNAFNSSIINNYYVKMYAFTLPDVEQRWPLRVLGLTVAVFLIFHTTCSIAQWRRRGYSKLKAVVAQRLVGAALLGILPAVVVALSGRSLWDFGLRWGAPESGAALFAIVAGVVLPLSFLQSYRPEVWRHYPELRLARWSLPVILLNAASWIIFLIGYELLFRGILLFTLAQWIGPWPAVGAMTAIYTLAHLDKPAGEAFGCIPMGIVFGWTALVTGSIWPVVVAHSVIAVFNDWGVVRNDPTRSFG